MKRTFLFIISFCCPVILLVDFLIKPTFFYSSFVEYGIVGLSAVAACLTVFFYKSKKSFFYKLLTFLNLLSCLLITVLVVLEKYNLLSVFSSINDFKNFIISTREKGMIIYVLIQMLQVIFIPIPSMVITLTGVAIYGPLVGALLCSLGVLLGSAVSFLLGKSVGFKVVSWLVGEGQANKYAKLINDRGKFFLIIAFLLPLFPDDILCLIAGITTMKFSHFLIISVITRPIGVFCMSFFGGGYIIPFTGWGLYVWPIILVLAIAAVVVTTKYQVQIETWILKKIKVAKK